MPSKKIITYIILAAIAAAIIYFAYDFIKKRKALQEKTSRVLANPDLRAQAEQRSARNKTTLEQEARAMAGTMLRVA